MIIKYIETRKQKKQYIDFFYKLYDGDENFVDTSIFNLETFLYKTDSFTRNSYIQPVLILDNGSVTAQCIYIYNEALNYFQIGFFEALPYATDAVDLIIADAQKKARDLNVEKIIIGMNGHVSYGVGFLTRKMDEKISFDSRYNKLYYKDYFDKYSFEEHTLSTYSFDLNSITQKIKSLCPTLGNTDFRIMDMRNFKNELLLLGDLCNLSLHDTFLYFDRPPSSIYELMSPLKPFLKPENLIFAMKDGKEVGFIFWHPDYNEILPAGRKNSLIGIGLKYLINQRKIKKVKINAIGVIPEYQSTGLALGLIQYAYQFVCKQFSTGENNFVWDNNIKSRSLNQKITDSIDKTYSVYIQKVE